MEPTPRHNDFGIADVLIGAGVGAWEVAWRAVRPLRVATGAVVGGAARALEQGPTRAAEALADRGQQARIDLQRTAEQAFATLLPWIVNAVLAAIDLNQLISRVDLNALLASVDLDPVIARVDLNAAVSRVDLNAAVSRVDLNAIVATMDLDPVIARVDLNAAVARVDLNAAVSGVDLNAAVARVDLNAAVSGVDLNAAVSRVDLNAIVASVDLDPIIARVDVVGIATNVIDAIDLPEIVRDSTGTMASEAVRSVRTEGIHADDALAGFVDRLLRRSRAAQAPELP